MLEAAAYGVPSITAFVNSAPAPLTSGGASCNGSFVNGESLYFWVPQYGIAGFCDSVLFAALYNSIKLLSCMLRFFVLWGKLIDENIRYWSGIWDVRCGRDLPLESRRREHHEGIAHE